MKYHIHVAPTRIVPVDRPMSLNFKLYASSDWFLIVPHCSVCLCLCVDVYYFIFLFIWNFRFIIRQVVWWRWENKKRTTTKKRKKLELEIISKVQNRILGRIEIAINPEDDPNWKTGRRRSREWAVKQEWPENLSPNPTTGFRKSWFL